MVLLREAPTSTPSSTPASKSATSRANGTGSSSPREHHTFRGNLGATRHGWLRLTPAYSVRLVRELLGAAEPRTPVLDPFCGTGTTLLACSERGMDCDTVDINPFLVWLAGAKVGSYSAGALDDARRGLDRMRRAVLRSASEAWVPPLHQIEKWWSPSTLAALSRAHRALERFAEGAEAPALDLLRIAFCQVLIRASRADFGHQSMSFRAPDAAAPGGPADVADDLRATFERLALAASSALPETRRRIVVADARRLHEALPRDHYGLVITSPPYANRMSYIRELRPYMYWLKYLENRTAAGKLDWQAIGGTWGSATSNLMAWSPAPGSPPLPHSLGPRLATIAESSPLLSTYVRKYFHDMAEHIASLAQVMRRGGLACFVVGNSKFYDVVVPVEQLLAEQFETSGFRNVQVVTLRKRSSKKELFEYLIRAERS